jgi:hypothetical protein
MKIQLGCAVVGFLSVGMFMAAQTPDTKTSTISARAAVANRSAALGGLPPVSGSGTPGYIPEWQNSTTLGDSTIFEDSLGICIGTTTPLAALDVNGSINAATSFFLGGNFFASGSFANADAFLGFAGNSTMTGVNNTATGYQALLSATTGFGNTASGYVALLSDTDGDNNTATGNAALSSNTAGSGNTANGAGALFSNTTGSFNTATGLDALHQNTGSGTKEGSYNTASGYLALTRNTSGQDNTASGMAALENNTTGMYNVGFGGLTLQHNVNGSYNTALGFSANVLSDNLTNATAIGAFAKVGASNSLVLGGIGRDAVKVGIGITTPSNVFTIAQNAGEAISDGWTTYSSRRWKTNIQTLHNALGTVEQLRGVSYDLKANGKHEVGVIAEEVGTVLPEVVTWDTNGNDARGVDYGRLGALLIEATKEQQVIIRKQQVQLDAQQGQIQAERERGNAQRTQIAQLVSQVKLIQGSLQSSRRTSAEIRRARTQAVLSPRRAVQ